MKKKKTIPWLEIKAEYLKGCNPADIAQKFDVDIEKLYNKIDNSGWTKERKEFQGKIRNDVAEHISRVTELALKQLERILNNSNIKDSDLINAIGKAFDVSGLKSSKHEVTGKDGQPIIQQTFLTPAECNSAIEHIKDYIKND